jgi:hypothetical protein
MKIKLSYYFDVALKNSGRKGLIMEETPTKVYLIAAESSARDSASI